MDSKGRILIVDDDRPTVMIIERVLKKHGYDVSTAFDGKEGLRRAREEKPHLIISDVMMPEMDGYEMCKELKDDEKYCDIPVILLTAVASHVTSTRYSHADGMSTEADDYIAKPASAEEIVRSIKRLLSN